MKIVERKTGLNGVANLIVGENGAKTYEVSIEGKETKTIAESTFKKQYKIVEAEEVSLVDMALNPEIIENEVAADKENAVELVEVEEVEENELVDMALNPEIVETAVVEANTEKTEKIEIVLTEEEQAEVDKAVAHLSSVIKALPVDKVSIEKNGHNSKVILGQVGMIITVDYKNSLMENIANSLKELMQESSVEVEFKNMQKRPNPAAFKARGVRVTGADGEEKTFKTRNDAMIWITGKFENNELATKPTYYQVKKALENNLEYAGYKWEEIDPTQAIVEA